MHTKQIAGKRACMAKGQSQSARHLDCSITTTAYVSLGLFGFQEIYAMSLGAFQNLYNCGAPHQT